MKKAYVILSILLLVVVAVFTTFNATIVNVNLLFTKPQTTVALLVLVSLAAGMILMALFDLIGRFRSGAETRNLKKQLKAAEEERDLLKKRVQELGAGGSNLTNKR